MDAVDAILTAGGIVAGIATFIGLLSLVLTIYFIYLRLKYLSTGIEFHKSQIELAKMQMQELDYKRTTHYSMEASYFETQTKLANKELSEK